MKKNMFSCYFPKKNEGGILFSVLGLLSLTTILTIYVCDSLKMTLEFYLQTKDYYIAQTVQELAYQEVSQNPESKKITLYYNHGNVRMNRTRTKLELKTTLKNGFQLYNNQFIEEKE